MSESTSLEEVRRRGVETTGIEIVEEAERTARPSDLFWPWFAANISVFGISYGSFVLGFGISFAQAAVVTVVGVVLSFVACGIIAIAGKRGSAPTMILSRGAFGVRGQKLPGVVSWLVSIGWETFLAIMAVLATATVFRELGWSDGTAVQVIAMVAIAGLIVAASVAGYHVIMRLQSYLTWITGIVTVLYIGMTLDQIDMAAVTAVPGGSTQQVIGALVMVMTGFGLGWINIAADWSRYQRRDTSGGAIVAWNTIGGALAPTVLVLYGLLLVGSIGDQPYPGGEMTWSDAIAADPVGALATLLPTWLLLPYLAAAVLALASGAVLGIYSSGLTLLSLGVRLPRPAAAGIDGVILTLGAVYVVFFAEDFLGPFQSFLITLGVPLAAWAGIMMADIALRRRDYDEQALFDARGRYGSVDVVAVVTMIVATVIGWGLVTNGMPDSEWNNWQGYLLKAFLGTELVEDPAGNSWAGDWSYANLGVLAALAIGFVVSWVARRPTVRRQEAGMVDDAEREPVQA